MSQPYVGECRLGGWNFAPAGWQFCDGSILPISEWETLFNLIGTTYGGDGQSTFAVPDLRGRVPIHQGNGFTLAETGGVETVTLTTSQIPVHSHPLQGSADNGNSNFPEGNVLAANPTFVYVTTGPPNPNKAMTYVNGSPITPVGGSQPHDNLQPYLTLSWVISLFGIFPSQT